MKKMRNAIQILIIDYLEGLKKCEDNIKVHLKETLFEDVDCIQLSQWRTPVNR
jgi:hypothetical protein